MANARITQSMLALETDGWDNAQPALRFANEAVEHAKRTANRRIRARAYVWRGETLLNAPYNDPDEARKSYDAAKEFWTPGDRDYLLKDLRALNKKIRKHPGPDPTIVRLTRGSVADRPLREIRKEVEKR